MSNSIKPNVSKSRSVGFGWIVWRFMPFQTANAVSITPALQGPGFGKSFPALCLLAGKPIPENLPLGFGKTTL